VSYIDYPLAPENTYHTTHEMVDQSYKLLIDKYPDDNFILMGDSAGGGLALAFAQKLINDKTTKYPVKCVLFSPWIDLSMTNPLIKQQEIKDIILPLKGLMYAAQKYAGNEDLYNYLLSPINGDFNGLPTTLILYGSEELFCPDIESLKEKIKNIGNFIFRRFEGMQHDWVILPIPEADDAIKTAIDFILENSESNF
jgi:acetyl esterase/lipase